jgi:hypothetical protein
VNEATQSHWKKQMCEDLKRVKRMNASVEAQDFMKAIGGGKDVKPQIAIPRAFERIRNWCHQNERPDLSLSRNRVGDIWRGRRDICVSGDELALIKEVASKKNEEATRAQLRSTVELLRILVDRLAAVDENFHHEAIAAFRETLGSHRHTDDGLGLGDRSLDIGGAE